MRQDCSEQMRPIQENGFGRSQAFKRGFPQVMFSMFLGAGDASGSARVKPIQQGEAGGALCEGRGGGQAPAQPL